MFFMMGITDGRRDFEFSQLMTCPSCRAYGRWQVFMTYTQLLLFFIPCLKWNRRYYVQAGCCGAVYELDAEIGAQIARGEQAEIREEHIRQVHAGHTSRRCGSCGYVAQADFEFCPKCGCRL